MTTQLSPFRVPVFVFFVLAAFIVFATSCDKGDQETHRLIKEKLDAVPAWKDVNASVKDGNVELKGSVKTEAERNECESSIKNVHGVKSVLNNIDVHPDEATNTSHNSGTTDNSAAVNTVHTTEPTAAGSTEDTDPVLIAAKKALKEYPNIQVEVADDEITVRGDVTKSEANDIMEKLNALKPKKVNNKLNIIKG